MLITLNAKSSLLEILVAGGRVVLPGGYELRGDTLSEHIDLRFPNGSSDGVRPLSEEGVEEALVLGLNYAQEVINNYKPKNTYLLMDGKLTTSTYDDFYICKVCGSSEVTYNQSIDDAHCDDCDKWQNTPDQSDLGQLSNSEAQVTQP